MISFFLIVEMTNASDVRSVSVLLRPVDGVSLYFECLEYVVSVIFDHIIVNVAAFGATLGSGLNINCRHTTSPYSDASVYSVFGAKRPPGFLAAQAGIISRRHVPWNGTILPCCRSFGLRQPPNRRGNSQSPAGPPRSPSSLACAVALATPTDMATANAATVKVFNILSSSLFWEKAAVVGVAPLFFKNRC
jgi:hypothetical protein